MKTYNEIRVIKKSPLQGKELVVNYRSSERFIIMEETIGGGVIVLCNDGVEYCFDLCDDVQVIN